MKIENNKYFIVINNQQQKEETKIKVFCDCDNKISYLDENMYFCNNCNKLYKREK